MGDVGDAAEHIGKPGLRIDVVELRCGDEAEHEGGALPAAVRTGEEPRFSAQGYTPERAFRRVVRQADTAVIEEGGEGRPCLEHVIHGLGYIAVLL